MCDNNNKPLADDSLADWANLLIFSKYLSTYLRTVIRAGGGSARSIKSELPVCKFLWEHRVESGGLHWEFREDFIHMFVLEEFPGGRTKRGKTDRKFLKSSYGHQSSGSSVQFSSVTQLCPTFCDPVDCSMPGLPVHHQLREFTQTHAHWVSVHLICFEWIYVYNMNWIKFYFMNKFIQLMQQHLLITFLFSLFSPSSKIIFLHYCGFISGLSILFHWPICL